MCEFCDAMERNQKFARFHRQFYPGESFRYSVAIVQRIFINGRRGSQGRSTDYRFHGIGYKLNYCPECGKKMSGGTA